MPIPLALNKSDWKQKPFNSSMQDQVQPLSISCCCREVCLSAQLPSSLMQKYSKFFQTPSRFLNLTKANGRPPQLKHSLSAVWRKSLPATIPNIKHQVQQRGRFGPDIIFCFNQFPYLFFHKLLGKKALLNIFFGKKVCFKVLYTNKFYLNPLLCLP